MAVTQASYRIRNDDGTEATATWKAAANTTFLAPLGAGFRVRFLLQVATAISSTGFVLMRSLNGGAYTAVTASSTVVKAIASPNVADGAATTKQLGVGTFVAGTFDEVDGAWATVSVAIGSETEMECSIQIVPADVKPRDTIALRVYQTTSIALGAYTNTPTLTVPSPNLRPRFIQQAVSRAANW
jgi:hypothetical protein